MRWSETSLIVTWLTDQFGTVRTVARGALRERSTFASRLELFERAEIVFAPSSKSTLHTLKEVAPICSIRFDGFAPLAVASYFAELSALVSPAMQPAADICDLLRRGLNYVASNPPGEKALRHFESECARILGVLDPSGSTSPAHSLEALCGKLPRTRHVALTACQQEDRFPENRPDDILGFN